MERLAGIAVGDRCEMKKAHPCGSALWRVVRIGADIGLECTGCGRKILLSRRELAQRLKGLPQKAAAPQEEGSCRS